MPTIWIPKFLNLSQKFSISQTKIGWGTRLRKRTSLKARSLLLRLRKLRCWTSRMSLRLSGSTTSKTLRKIWRTFRRSATIMTKTLPHTSAGKSPNKLCHSLQRRPTVLKSNTTNKKLKDSISSPSAPKGLHNRSPSNLSNPLIS